jgi:hypothetical protein
MTTPLRHFDPARDEVLDEELRTWCHPLADVAIPVHDARGNASNTARPSNGSWRAHCGQRRRQAVQTGKRLMTMRRLCAGGAAAVALLLAAGAQFVPGRSISASADFKLYLVSLSGSFPAGEEAGYLLVGDTATLTADASWNYGPTRDWLHIVDTTTNTVVQQCSGYEPHPCTYSVSYGYPTTHTYVAYAAPRNAPLGTQSVQGLWAQSQPTTVSWRSQLVLNGPTFLVNTATATLTASSTWNVGQSPIYKLQIFDQTIGSRVAVCSSGKTCPYSVTHSARDSHTYRAYIARLGSNTQDPPPAVQAVSNLLTVEWHYLG